MPETTEFIYQLSPVRMELLSSGPTDIEEAILAEHFEYLKRLTEAGTVALAGRTLTEDESAFGIVILKDVSERVARRIMNEDPAVFHTIMTARLFPFRIALKS
jgi:uncharacterized protein YciI